MRWSPEDDDDATRALEANGFVRDELHFIELLRDLEARPPASAPPPGFRLATLATAGSAEAYVELHRDAWARWGPSSYSIEAHRRLEAMPGYDPSLVPVAVAPDGRLAASCICWLDAATLVGEIEPLGTARAFGRLGRKTRLRVMWSAAMVNIERLMVIGEASPLPRFPRPSEHSVVRPARCRGPALSCMVGLMGRQGVDPNRSGHGHTWRC